MVVNIRVKLNTSRIPTIVALLEPLKNTIIELVCRDPQYVAIKRIISARGPNSTSLLVILNSTISYKLSITGENYWLRFADFFSRIKDRISLDTFRLFLVQTGHTRLLSQKLRRIGRVLASDLAVKILENGLLYCNNIKDLVNELAGILDSERSSKTIVFAAKMYGYVCYLAGIEPNFADIPIPVDYRNSLLALTSCIIEDCGSIKNIKECAKRLASTKYAMYVRDAWSMVCSGLNIPCLLLDTFTWLFAGKAISAEFAPRKVVELFKGSYGVDISIDVAETLLECAEKYV